ncbi:hypothetical protein BOX15_Mlig030420g1 [Macrostomum lignano]|uniref:LIM zinc-binding domain-containing protein n=1 Tax=Macrostomum lignano TaxID=282301 RepID=A0A267EM76_9PLAT|nr:hypothetical protein BOX15_Mlig030420g1 [Macrostomum lignano]
MNRRLVAQFATGPQQCYRCGKTVYPTEKIGPLNEAVFHKNCFRCQVCGLSLTLSSYCANPSDSADREVYCSGHRPQLKNAQMDVDTVGMRTALTAQTLYNRSRDRDAGVHRGGQVDSQAISIRQAVAVTKIRSEGRKATFSRHHFNPGPRRSELLEAQKALEQRHRAEEDRLLREMMADRQQKEQHLEAEIKETWEARLQEMTRRRAPDTEKEAAHRTIRFKEAEQRDAIESQFQELAQERTAELVSRQSREMLQLLSRKQKEIEKEQTAKETSQQKQNKEEVAGGLGVAQINRGVDFGVMTDAPVEQTAAVSSMSTSTTSGVHQQQLVDRQTQSSRAVDGFTAPGPGAMTADRTTQWSQVNQGSGAPHQEADLADRTTQAVDLLTIDSASDSLTDAASSTADANGMLSFIPDRVPSPCAPSRPKSSLYTDAGIFGQLDDHVIRIAEDRQQLTFTELAEQLTANCMSELEKVRAIFRWITVKDLSTLHIDNQWNPDTPMGLLRSIQFGTETYHVLFMRLCSYAGIHAVEIKGYSKSAGYEPCMQFRNAHQFKNTWNAVFIDGDWRLVQCNWAARRIVRNRNRRPSAIGTLQQQQHQQTLPANPNQPTDGKNLRYDYDEHYFLTDPEKFIYEFFPFEPKWQLLDRPIGLTDFEALPFVRSDFFHFGMEFPADTKALLEANEFGGAALEISLRQQDLPLMCHFQFRCAETGAAYYQGAQLDRYIFFSVPTPGSLVFDVHVPSRQAYYLEIFAAVVQPHSPSLYGNQVRMKSVAKFKVSAAALQKRMNPLPKASGAGGNGEWGPAKALRHFGVKPMNHGSAVINFDASQGSELTVEFWVPDDLLQEATAFTALLHKNGLTSQTLNRYIRIRRQGNVLLLLVRPPESGVYALELFLERAGCQATHVCKYLLRCSGLPEQGGSLARPAIDESKVKPGASGSSAKRLGLTAESKFKLTVQDAETMALRFGVKGELDFAVTLTRLAQQQQPAEDHSDNCETSLSGQSATVLVNFVSGGRYHLHLLAKRPADQGFELCYSYRIDVTLPKIG